MKELLSRACVICGVTVAMSGGVAAQQAAPQASQNGALPAARQTSLSDYVIGLEDVLRIAFWREGEMSIDVVVRPDGYISLPLLNDVRAAGYTPEELGSVLQHAAAEFIADPTVTVIVREINSRTVSVLGEVGRPGTVRLSGTMNVLHVLAEVGGFQEHAKRNDVVIIRPTSSGEERFHFNYGDVLKGRRPEQNITLRPGDIILVR